MQSCSNRWAGLQSAGFRFLDLPRELQTQILRYVVAPGEVYLEAFTGRWGFVKPDCQCAYRKITKKLNVPIKPWLLQSMQRTDLRRMEFPNRRYFKTGGSPSRQQSGFQVLATCLTIYADHHEAFYSKNAFHLQPGPITIASDYFDKLQPKHKLMIKSIVITFSIADLTPQGFQYIDDDIKLLGKIFRSMNRAQQVSTYIESSMATLILLWSYKVQWLLKWQTLESAELRGSKYRYAVKREKMESVFDGTIYSDMMILFWSSCRRLARKQLTERFNKCDMKVDSLLFPMVILDVDPVRDWLSTLGPRIRCKPGYRKTPGKRLCPDALQELGMGRRPYGL